MMSNEQRSLAAFIEELASNTWPAKYVQHYGSWTFRANDGASKRANSVLPLGAMPSYAGWLDEVRAFYASHRLPARFSISDASPPELDSMLEQLGYAKETECSIMIASARDAASQAAGNRLPEGYSASFCTRPWQAWMDAYVQIEGYAEEMQAKYRDIVSRIAPRKSFILVQQGDEAAGIGTVVAERGWAGFVNIAVSESHRQKGLATFIMAALSEQAVRLGAQSLYLQVVNDNAPALALYGKLGFTPLYRYHYRTEIGSSAPKSSSSLSAIHLE